MTGRVLVTGASGFLGRQLIGALLAEGTTTVALCRRPGTLTDLAHPKLSTMAGDVRDAGTAARLLSGVDTLFHLAAVRNRPGTSVDEMTAVNEVATSRWVRQAAAAGVRRIVNLSTALVFGPSATPLDEASPVVVEGRSSAYAASKARGLLAVRELAKAGAPVVSLLPTIVFGPDHPSRPNRVTSHLRRVLRLGVDVVIQDGRARRDLVHAADVVAAMLAAARRAPPGSEILIAGEPISQRELGETARRAAGRRPPLVFSVPVRIAKWAARVADRARGNDPGAGFAVAVDALGREWTFCGDRARALLDHRPRPIAAGIAETVAWIQRGSR